MSINFIPTPVVDPLPAIGINPEPEDFTRRAVHVQLVLSLVKDFLTNTVKDALENDASGTVLDAELLETIDAHLDDLSADIAGTFNRTAEKLLDERYDGCPRGAMYRRRGI